MKVYTLLYNSMTRLLIQFCLLNQSEVTSVPNSLLKEESRAPLGPGTGFEQQLQFCTKLDSLPTFHKEECILLQQRELTENLSKSKGLSKIPIFEEEGDDKLYINCVKHIFEDLYLFGCEDGLYARKASDKDRNTKIKIEGVGSIHQIEFIPKINYALMTEGKPFSVIFLNLFTVNLLRISFDKFLD